MNGYGLRVAAALYLALAATSPGTAQGTTWIVDELGGPGVHFTEVPPAVAAASDGDTIVIRSGTYSGFSTGKALTLLGEGSVMVYGALPFSPAIEVAGLGRGKTFVVKNLVFSTNAMCFRDNDGRVHLEDVSTPGPGSFSAGVVLDISNCNEVTVTGGSLEGGIGVRVSDSTVSLTSVVIRGANTTASHTICYPGTPGIEAHDSTVYLSRTDVRGGDGVRYMALSTLVYCPAHPAIVATGGVVTVTGNSGTTIEAGDLRPGFPTPALSISMPGSAVVDTELTLIPTRGAPPVQGSATFRRVVSLTASGEPPGSAVTGEIVCPAGDPVALLVGRSADPLPTPFGTLFVDPALFVASGVATQGPSERFPFALSVPGVPRLRGAPIALQAVHVDRARGALELSNPAVVILD